MRGKENLLDLADTGLLFFFFFNPNKRRSKPRLSLWAKYKHKGHYLDDMAG